MTAATTTRAPSGMSDALVVSTVPHALRLAAAVRDHDVDTAHDVLTSLSPVALQALAVALASMVQEDASVDDVLVYCEPATRDRYASSPSSWSDTELRRLHAAFQRRDRRSPRVDAGESEYQRRTRAKRKARDDVNARALAFRAQQAAADRGVA